MMLQTPFSCEGSFTCHAHLLGLHGVEARIFRRRQMTPSDYSMGVYSRLYTGTHVIKRLLYI
jgi:hypothetical protein